MSVVQADELVRPALTSQCRALQSADNFTWQSLLDYKPTSIKCPHNIEQLVCDYAAAYWQSVVVAWLYCSGKYESAASDCKADALCKWQNSSAKCESDKDKAYLNAERIGTKFLLDRMTDGADKRVAEADYACSLLPPWKGCKGTCYFDQKDWYCRPRKDTLAAIFTEPGKNSTDAFCTYLKVDGFSPCSSRFSEHKCEKNKFCRWTDFYECVPKEEFYLLAAADEDPRLKRRYRKFEKTCARHTTKEACVEPTKAV